MTDWQSMETHPVSGERVLLATDDGTVGIGYFDAETGWFMMEMEADGEGDCEPVAWMPLPAHPSMDLRGTVRN